LGDFIAAHSHLTQALNFYDPYKHHHALLILRGSDAGLGAMAYDICCLWIMGYPDQALKMYKNVISLSHEFGHPFSMADVLCFGGCLFNAMQREGEALESNANELVQLAKERNLTGWLATGIRYQGEALAIQGKIDDGIAQARAGMEAMQGESILMHFTETLSSLAEAQMKTGNLCEVIPILRDAKQIVEKNQERFWESELNRLEGEFHLLQGQVANAEASFMKAIEVSREQSAKSLELRAVMSLCRMWAERGKKAEARLLLDEIYRWFSEGFNTPDLIKAGKLLKDLS
jgi:adenylate cyclase